MLVISIILGPLGNVFLGKGMKGVGALNFGKRFNLIPILIQIFSSPYIWLGISCLIGFFIVHMLLLTWADYSYVQPATSLSYASITILSYFILGEVISPLRLLGVLVICSGVFIVGLTHPNTTGATHLA
jgi:uncharacterized membrane protein